MNLLKAKKQGCVGAALLFRIISVQANNKQESAVIMENS